MSGRPGRGILLCGSPWGFLHPFFFYCSEISGRFFLTRIGDVAPCTECGIYTLETAPQSEKVEFSHQNFEVCNFMYCIVQCRGQSWLLPLRGCKWVLGHSTRGQYGSNDTRQALVSIRSIPWKNFHNSHSIFLLFIRRSYLCITSVFGFF